MKSKANLARFLLLALLWGSSFPFITVSLEGLTPSQLVLIRLLLGAAVLASVAAVRRIPLPRSVAVWGHIAVAAALGNVIPFMLLSYGEQHTAADIAGVLVGSTPLLTMGLATALLPSERVTVRRALGLLAGFIGVVVIVGPWRSSLGSVGSELACFGTAVSYAAGFVYVRKYLSPRGLPPLALAAGQLLSATVIQALTLPVFAWHTPHFYGRVIASLLLLGALNTGLAYVLYFYLINALGATTASAVNYVVPVAAVIISVILLGERLSWNLLVGGIIVLAGMAYAENRIKRPARAAVRSAPAGQPVPAAAERGAGGRS